MIKHYYLALLLIFSILTKNVNATCSLPAAVSITSPANPAVLCEGSSMTLKGAAAGLSTPVNGSYYYTWFKGTTAITSPSTTYSDYIKASVSITDAGTYKLRVEDGNAGDGACYREATVTVSINPMVTPSVSIVPNTATTICEGGTVSLVATPGYAGETNPVYTWMVGSSTLSQSASTVTVPASLLTAIGSPYTITAKLHSSLTCVTVNDATSNVVNVAVSASFPVSVSLSNPAITCQGSPATFTATPTNGGSAPTYQWYIGASLQASTSSTFTSSTLNNGDIVKVSVSSNTTCASNNPASAQRAANIFTVPAISIGPVNPNPICTGGSIVLTATITGGTANVTTYEWLESNTAIASPSTIGPYVAFTTGTYSVKVNFMGGCSGTSNPSMVTVVTPPSPSISGADATICQGASVTFDIIPSYAGLSTYQWYINGSPINGATAGTYTATQSGVYSVSETYFCKRTTEGRTVTVNPSPCAPSAVVPKAEKKLSVYPNPAFSEIVFEGFENSIGSEYEIRDLSGKMIASGILNNRLSVFNLEKGLYVIKIKTDNEVMVGKFVKE